MYTKQKYRNIFLAIGLLIAIICGIWIIGRESLPVEPTGLDSISNVTHLIRNHLYTFVAHLIKALPLL